MTFVLVHSVQEKKVKVSIKERCDGTVVLPSSHSLCTLAFLEQKNIGSNDDPPSMVSSPKTGKDEVPKCEKLIAEEVPIEWQFLTIKGDEEAPFHS